MDEAPASFMLDESMGFKLSGAGSASVLPIPADEITGQGGGLKIIAGTLQLTSTKADASITVAEGQCLLPRSAADPRTDESHELFKTLEAGACP